MKIEKNKLKNDYKAMFFISIFILGILILALWKLNEGSFTIEFSDNSFSVETANWNRIIVDYQDIEEISYEQGVSSYLTSDIRTNGIGNWKISMGTYYNDEYGSYQRYTYKSCAAYVKIITEKGIVVINKEDEGATKELFDTLETKIGK